MVDQGDDEIGKRARDPKRRVEESRPFECHAVNLGERSTHGGSVLARSAHGVVFDVLEDEEVVARLEHLWHAEGSPWVSQ